MEPECTSHRLTSTTTRTFFSTSKRLQGKHKQALPYIKDHHNKIHKTSDKEELFRSHWSKIFRNDQNDEYFDQKKIELVTNNNTANSDSLHPLLHSDIDILDPSFPPIITRELDKTIHHLKHRSPYPYYYYYNGLILPL